MENKLHFCGRVVFLTYPSGGMSQRPSLWREQRSRVKAETWGPRQECWAPPGSSSWTRDSPPGTQKETAVQKAIVRGLKVVRLGLHSAFESREEAVSKGKEASLLKRLVDERLRRSFDGTPSTKPL